MKRDLPKNSTENNAKADLINSAKVAEILGISTATVRNWVKLGKLNAVSEGPLLFNAKEILVMHKKLEKTSLLKSRRNKTRLAENFIPKNYISCSSPNYNSIKDILEEVSRCSLNPHEVIWYCAKELLTARQIPAPIKTQLLHNFQDQYTRQKKNNSIFTLPPRLKLQYIPGEDTLGMLYLSLRRLQDKKSTGSYYTPFYVVDRLIEEAGDISNSSICDPACGTGNFLLRLPDRIPLAKIYGSDIDRMAVSIARINLALKYDVKTLEELDTINNNLTVRNFLHNNASNQNASQEAFRNEHFDIILGNPPWGYVFSQKEIAEIKTHFSSYNSAKNPESFTLFVERALEHLNDGGTLSFLLPETILSAETHRGIRRYIHEKARVSSISYLGDVFHKVQCPSVILRLRATGNAQRNNKKGSNEAITVSFNKAQKEKLVTERSFIREDYPIDENSFLILANAKEHSILKHIFSVPHFTLEGQAEFALGIVTGSNSSLLKKSLDGHTTGNFQRSDTAVPVLEPILKGKDIEKYYTHPATSYVHFAPETFQQCAPTRFYRADKKLFYRFIADEPIVAMDTAKTLSLNSANILIPEVPGYSAEYIMAVLNSQVISFYYKKTYKNLKVLRSYLEQLPIAKCSREEQDEIKALVLEIIATPARAGEKHGRLQQKIDERIAALYNLEENLLFLNSN